MKISDEILAAIIGTVLSTLLAVTAGALAWSLDQLVKLKGKFIMLSARMRFLELQHKKRGLLDAGKSDTDFLKP